MEIPQFQDCISSGSKLAATSRIFRQQDVLFGILQVEIPLVFVIHDPVNWHDQFSWKNYPSLAISSCRVFDSSTKCYLSITPPTTNHSSLKNGSCQRQYIQI